ncbi:MAG: AAA family ATPase, partial [Verrucomicrobia bacterium]|nr:AAA family ATPase [Verrucomicrobiota bacterium]
RGDFQIEGVPEELCERFSKRHEQINDALDDLLANKPELNGANLKDLRERLATAERSRKVRDLAPSELRRLWDAQLTNDDRRALANLTKTSVSESPRETLKVVQEAIEWAEEHLFDRRSVVSEAEIWECALEHARGQSIDLDTLKRQTAARGYLRDPKIPWQITTAPVLQREWEIVATAANGVGEFQPFVSRELTLNPELDGEQAAALKRLARSRDFISLFRGGAGTGKSFVLRELAVVLASSDWPLAVIAPQRQQVLELEAAGFPVPTTVAGFLAGCSAPKGTVVIVDEAGQIGARQMLDLIRRVASVGGRLVLSGDTRQHGPVEASDALLAIERYSGLKPVELEQIRRQNPDLAKNQAERAAIAAYRRAVESAAAGRLQESFDRLDRMGALVTCRFDEQQQNLAAEYLRLMEKGHSIVVVSQTWSEVHRVNEQVRAALKTMGRLGNEEWSVQALERIDLTSAQKRDVRFHETGNVIVFNQKVRNVVPGETGRFVSVLSDGVLVEVGKRVVKVPKRHLDRIAVCRLTELPISSGDRLQLKANRRQRDGRSVVNGELVTVRSVRPDGAIELEDGRVLDAGYREFVPGYAVTSYGSQGKTVDYVLFSDSAVKVATNDQQWYVTISRGRKGIRIYTPDKEQLRENVIRSGQRKLALDVAGPQISPSRHRKAPRQVLTRWYQRFGRRAAQLMTAVRQVRRFNRNRQEKHERQIKHQTTRVLVD